MADADTFERNSSKPKPKGSFIDSFMDRQAAKLAQQLDEFEDVAVEWGGKVGEAGKEVKISAKDRLGKVKETIDENPQVKRMKQRQKAKVRPIRSPGQTSPRPVAAKPSQPGLSSRPPKSKVETHEPTALVRSYVHLVTGQPIITIVIVLALTLVSMLGIGNTHINGSMDVYLPKDSIHTEIVREVREHWSTDLVVIYVQSSDNWEPNPQEEPTTRINITQVQVLKAMEELEKRLDPYGQDPANEDSPDALPLDGVVFTLSVSTIIKELNSSNARAYQATVKNLDEYCDVQIDGDCPDEWTTLALSGNNEDYTGRYAIPDDQNDIDNRVDDIPRNLLSKMVVDTNGNGVWDAAVIVIGITEEVDASAFIDKVNYELKHMEGFNPAEPKAGLYTMELTGTVPVTLAITERSFSEFWRVFPVGVGLAAVGIFIFHRRIRAVLIAGVPTLLAVLMTYGLIGWSGIEVTPTIIALGPILMALGVAYGLHLTNRFTDENHPDLQERMVIAMSTTGKAILLSAVTTIIGFSSLIFSKLSPIQTVGISLTLGIAVCVLMTFALSPAIAVLTQYDKRKSESEWDKVADVPTYHNNLVIIVAIILVMVSGALLSAGVLESDIDYLEMAPDDEVTLVGIKKYSKEFEAGALGMILVRGQLRDDFDEPNPIAVDNLDQINGIQYGESPASHKGLVNVKFVTAISIIDLLKTVKFEIGISSEESPLPLPISFSQDVNRTFWEILHEDQVAQNKDLQTLLLNIFYDSLTNEARGMLMAPDYDKTLIYVDMPIISVKGIEGAVEEVNHLIDISPQPTIDVAGEGPHGKGQLTGVAAIGVDVNNQLISSQLRSIIQSVVFVFLVLIPTFRSWKLAALTTLPVVWVVALEPLTMVMMGQSLSLVTVMIGSIVIGVGVDFSIHITQRVSEAEMSLTNIHRAVRKTGLSLFEATGVTCLGLCASFLIAISALYWFVAIIMVLIVFSMLGAMFLLPAMYATIVNVSTKYDQPQT